jgi:hypothetical protein
MKVSYSVYGKKFKPDEFLLEIKYLPERFQLWDEETKDGDEEEDGFILDFSVDRHLVSLPFLFGRFLIANKELLKANQYKGASIVKEVTFSIAQENLEYLAENNQILIYTLTSSLMKLLGELNINIHIIKTK